MSASWQNRSHHFSHVHATFWLGVEQCSNRRRFLVPDESGARYIMTHVPETGAGIMELIYGASFHNVCHRHNIIQSVRNVASVSIVALWPCLFFMSSTVLLPLLFSALTLFVGRQEGHPARATETVLWSSLFGDPPQSPGSCNEQPTHGMEKTKRTSPRNLAEKWELFPKIGLLSPSTSASTRLGTVLQIVSSLSSGMNLSTLLCSSRSTPSRKERRSLR